MAIITWRSRFEMLVLASSTLMFVVYFQISMSVLVALAKVSLTFDRRKPGERNTRRSSCNCVNNFLQSILITLQTVSKQLHGNDFLHAKLCCMEVRQQDGFKFNI
jgi:hypothetical protein